MTTDTSPAKKLIIALLLLAAMAAIPVTILVKIHSRQSALHRRGVVSNATVIGTDDSRDPGELLVVTELCSCRLWLPTTNLRAHPVGSTVAVRFDPERPGRAELLVDRPNPYEEPLIAVVTFGLGIAISVPFVLAGLRRYKRSKRLAEESAPTARVRVEAWRRSFLNSEIPYLSVYAVDAPLGGEPLFCLPLQPETVAKIEDNGSTEFDLYGQPRAGQPVALRSGTLVITPAGGTKDGDWERRHRNANGTILLDTPGRADPLAGLPIFGDAVEARRWRRIRSACLWSYAALVPMMLLRGAPEAWFPVLLPAVFLVLFVLVVVLWSQRRLLNRLARRLPQPTSATRRGSKAARATVVDRIKSDAGRSELATLLNTSTDALAAADRRAVRVLIGSFAVVGVAFVLILVRVVTA